MKVKATQAHDNDYDNADGANYHKKVGAVYEIQDEAAAQALIDSGVVEAAKEGKAG